MRSFALGVYKVASYNPPLLFFVFCFFPSALSPSHVFRSQKKARCF